MTASPTENVRRGQRTARPAITSEDALEAAERGYEEPLDLMATNVTDMARIAVQEPLSDREFEDVAEYEQFMHNPVVIRIHETSDDNAPWVVFVGVNNDCRWLPRGVPVRIPRKFVERLAQAQEMRFSTKSNKDPEADNAMKLTRKVSQAYQFEVLKDAHPMGRRWLMRMVRQGS